MTLVVNFSERARSAPRIGLGLVADVAVEALDPVVLGRPRAHPERVPALPPALAGRAPAGLGRSSHDRQRQRLARQPADHRRRPPAGDVGPVDRPSAGRARGRQSTPRRPSDPAYGYSRAVSARARAKSSPAVCWAATTSVYRSGVSRRLDQREVADVAEVDREQLRRDPLPPPWAASPSSRSRAWSTISLTPSTDRLSSAVSSRRPALVQAGQERQLAEEEDQRPGVDGEGLDRREERLGLVDLEPSLVGVADPGPVQQRADEAGSTDSAAPARAAGRPSRRSARRAGRARGGGMAGRTAAANASGLTRFRAYGSGKIAVVRLEPGRLQVDERPRRSARPWPAGARRSPPGRGRSARS